MAIDAGFHWRHGWYFRRLNDGSVGIIKMANREGVRGEEISDALMEWDEIIPAAEWVSIIHHISLQTDYTVAEHFHAGDALARVPVRGAEGGASPDGGQA